MELVDKVISAVVMMAAELLVQLQEFRRQLLEAVGLLLCPYAVAAFDAFVHVTQQQCESQPLGALGRQRAVRAQELCHGHGQVSYGRTFKDTSRDPERLILITINMGIRFWC